MFAALTDFFSSITDAVIASEYTALLAILLGLVFSFLETVGVIGFIIPLNIFVIGVLAVFAQDYVIFFSICISVFIGSFLGVVVGHFFSKRFGQGIFVRHIKSNKMANDAIMNINSLLEKHKLYAIPLIMTSHMRSVFGLYRGLQGRNIFSILPNLLIGIFIYVFIEGILGWLIGKFGREVLSSFAISRERIIGIYILAILIFFLQDLRKRKQGK